MTFLRQLGVALEKIIQPLRPLGAVLKDAYEGMWTHNVSRMAASIAYFGAFSLAPILVIMVSLASLVFGKSASEGLIFDQLVSTFGDTTAAFIQSMLAAIYQSGGLTLATVLAVLVLMWSSTRIIGSVRGALNDIWGVHGYGGTGFRGFVVGKLIDLVMVVVLGVLFLASMLANTAISALTRYFSSLLPLPGYILQVGGVLFSLVVTTAFLTIIFRMLPNIRVRFIYILLGASITAILFSIGNYVIGRYLGRTSPGSAFGAAGSLAVIMIWMYLVAYIILFGAEITRAYAYRGTIRRSPTLEERTSSAVPTFEEYWSDGDNDSDDDLENNSGDADVEAELGDAGAQVRSTDVGNDPVGLSAEAELGDDGHTPATAPAPAPPEGGPLLDYESYARLRRLYTMKQIEALMAPGEGREQAVRELARLEEAYQRRLRSS